MDTFEDFVFRAALMSLTTDTEGSVSQYARNAVWRFLEETKAEDDWIEKAMTVSDGTALQVRVLLAEDSKGSTQALSDLPKVRKALQAFVKGVPIPPQLFESVRKSIVAWKAVAEHQHYRKLALDERTPISA